MDEMTPGEIIFRKLTDFFLSPNILQFCTHPNFYLSFSSANPSPNLLFPWGLKGLTVVLGA